MSGLRRPCCTLGKGVRSFCFSVQTARGNEAFNTRTDVPAGTFPSDPVPAMEIPPHEWVSVCPGYRTHTEAGTCRSLRSCTPARSSLGASPSLRLPRSVRSFRWPTLDAGWLLTLALFPFLSFLPPSLPPSLSSFLPKTAMIA